MGSLRVILLWHHHQPFYRDLRTGQYRLPWVRLHGLNEYYTMGVLAREFAELPLTFNLVPCLVQQLEEYARGEARDPWLDLSRRDPADLTESELALLLRWFFLVNPTTMITPHPRYQALAVLGGRAGHRWHPQELRDLQVWFNLAWTSPLLRGSDPTFQALTAKGRDFTEEEKIAFLQRQQELLGALIRLYRDLEAHGRVELSTSAFYHPILPLLCDSRVAREANPETRLPATPFVHPEDARWQVQAAIKFHEAHFGQRPRGLWPSEGSVSEAILPLLAEAGIRWIATDEILLHRSLGRSMPPRAPYAPEACPEGPVIFFRDHALSDRIGFVYARWKSKEAADDLIQRLTQRRQESQGGVLTLALDGENAWEHYPEQGIPFLRHLYEALLRTSDLELVTPETARSDMTAVPLARLHPGSWIDGDFKIWIGHPEDHKAWELLAQARGKLTQAETQGTRPPEHLDRARDALAIAEGSDWTWWYGEEHTSGNDDIFDDLFRSHLMAVWEALEEPPPEALSIPILGTGKAVRPTATPSGFIHPTIDGRITDYFEWRAAGRFTPSGGALHRAQSLLLAVAFGFDATHLYLRVDPTSPLATDLALLVELSAASPSEVRLALGGPKGEPQLLPEGGEAAVADVIEIALPLGRLGLAPGDSFTLAISLVDHQGREVERFPERGVFSLVVRGEAGAEIWEA
ncbi:MAG: glycoside hydrolase [Candidatus Rokubacteria bacterium]|nr:glycoside hydrolase [Candidatus Rokubacteria bacterium]